MRLTQRQPWQGIFNHIVSPHLRRVRVHTPRVRPSSPDGRASFRFITLMVVFACLSWTAPHPFRPPRRTMERRRGTRSSSGIR